MDTFNTKNPKIVASQKAPWTKNDTNFSEDSGIKKTCPALDKINTKKTEDSGTNKTALYKMNTTKFEDGGFTYIYTGSNFPKIVASKIWTGQRQRQKSKMIA